MDTSSDATPNAVGENSSVQNDDESVMSKRQMKRIRKREKWLERKSEKRILERQKAKEKRAHARANNIDLGPSRKALKKCTMATSNCRVAITIDMSFDDLMLDKDIAKLTKQILRCYTLNRRAVSPVQFSLTAFGGKSQQEMQKHNGYQHWDVNFFAESYLRVYQGRRIVYLTSESENVLYTLRSDCVYVIGGLVDHNSHKGHCHKLAMQQGIGHARLPLDSLMRMKARKVLTVDHVFEILLRVIEGTTWQQAFMQVLPLRKQAAPVSSTKTIGASKESEDSKSADCTVKSASDEAEIEEEPIDDEGPTSETKCLMISNCDEAKFIQEAKEERSQPNSNCAVISGNDETIVNEQTMEAECEPNANTIINISDQAKIAEESTEGQLVSDFKYPMVNSNGEMKETTDKSVEERKSERTEGS